MGAVTSVLEIAELYFGTKALGPGKRAVLYLQGCPFACKGCLAPEWRTFGQGRKITVKTLLKAFRQNAEGLMGLTISGGEPLSQARPLSSFLKLLREALPNWNIILFTGFEKAEWSPVQLEVIKQVDLVVTGRFIWELFTPRGLRGSRNQEFIYVSQRLLPFREEIENGPRRIELVPRKGGKALFLGLPFSPNLLSPQGPFARLFEPSREVNL